MGESNEMRSWLPLVIVVLKSKMTVEKERLIVFQEERCAMIHIVEAATENTAKRFRIFYATNPSC